MCSVTCAQLRHSGLGLSWNERWQLVSACMTVWLCSSCICSHTRVHCHHVLQTSLSDHDVNFTCSDALPPILKGATGLTALRPLLTGTADSMQHTDVRDLAMGANANGVGSQAGIASLACFLHDIAYSYELCGHVSICSTQICAC